MNEGEAYIGVTVHAQALNLVDDSLVIIGTAGGLHALDLTTHVLKEVLGDRGGLSVCRHVECVFVMSVDGGGGVAMRSEVFKTSPRYANA